MPKISKSFKADQDILGIWNYSADKWGEAQADKYVGKIENCCKKVVQGNVALRSFAEHVKFVRCERHYIFVDTKSEPIIIAIFHEKMDWLTHLEERLI